MFDSYLISFYENRLTFPCTKMGPRWRKWCLMGRVPTKRAGSLPVRSCPVTGPMSPPLKRSITSALKDTLARKIFVLLTPPYTIKFEKMFLRSIFSSCTSSYWGFDCHLKECPIIVWYVKVLKRHFNGQLNIYAHSCLSNRPNTSN